MKTEVRVWLGCAAAALAASLGFAQAEDVRRTPGEPLRLATVNYDLSALPLEEALRLFSLRTGVSLVYDNRLTREKHAPALHAALPPDIALTRLLSGSGLAYTRVRRDLWVITQTSALTPAPVIGVRERPDFNEIIVVAAYQPGAAVLPGRPDLSIGVDTLRYSGDINVAETIYDIPSVNAAFTTANTSLLGTSVGLNLADLHGLGPERTAVLVNGRRIVRASGGNGSIAGVDLNAIPAAFVEQIDIVNRGAGVIAGGDATAGAINFTLRQNYEGVAVTGQGGLTQRGDGEQHSVTIFAGRGFGDGAHVSGGITMDRQGGLLAADRKSTSQLLGFSKDGRAAPYSPDADFLPGFGGSTFTPNGRVVGVLDTAGEFVRFGSGEQLYLSNDGASANPFVRSLDQLYDWTQGQSTLIPVERFGGVVTASARVAPWGEVFVDALYTRSKVKSLLSPAPLSSFRGAHGALGDAIVVPVDNPFVPGAVRALAEQTAGEPASALVLERRFVELGPRRRKIERGYANIAAGLRGDIAGWQYEGFYQYSRSGVNDADTGLLNGDALVTALEPGACAAAPGCEPVDIFGVGKITPEQAAFVAAPGVLRVVRTQEHLFGARASGPLQLFTGHTARVSTGVDYTISTLSDTVRNPGDAASAAGGFRPVGAWGRVETLEGFADLTIPVLEKAPLAEHATLWTGLRGGHSSTTGGLFNAGVGGVWSPTGGITLFADYQHGMRAPNATELFSQGPNLQVAYADPCSDAALKNETRTENCRSTGRLGVPAGFVQSEALTQENYVGNPDLSAEHNRTWSAGVSFDARGLAPAFPGRLTITAAWRHFLVRDMLAGEDVNAVLANCYDSASLSDAYCGVNPLTGAPYIVRDPATGRVLSVASTLVNNGEFELDGVDANMSYTIDFSDAGPITALRLTTLYAYLHDVSEVNFDDLHPGSVAYPQHRIQSVAALETGPVTSTLTFRYRGRVDTAPEAGTPLSKIPGVAYIDLSVRGKLNDNITIFGGVENVFDRAAPTAAFADGFNTFPEYYDVLGRRFFMGVSAEF